LLKNILIPSIAILLSALIGSYCSYGSAQGVSNNTNTNTNLTATIYEKFPLSVDVFFESSHTVILSGKTTYSTDLWQALDLVKQFGYKIDAVAQVTEESSAVGNTRYLTPVYTIFLSK
jgi:hypothetical protein